MARSLRLRCAAVVVAAVVALLIPSVAQAQHPGRPDPTFGTNGRTVVPAPPPTTPETPFSNAEFGLSRGDDGRLLAFGGHTLVEFTANGKLRRRFGGNGRVTMPEGQQFQLAGAALDSRDRVIVVGTTTLPQSAEEMKERLPELTEVTILRYGPDGKLDRSFGNGGVFSTELGLPPLTDFQNSSGERVPWVAPRVRISGMALDSGDNLVVTGTALTGTLHYFIFYDPVYSGLIAKLRPSGEIDPSFGSNGVDVIADNRGLPSDPVMARGGGVYSPFELYPFHAQLGTPEPTGWIFKLGPEGQPDLSFGSAGLRQPMRTELHPAIAVDRSNRLLIVAQEPVVNQGPYAVTTVLRLLPDGLPDPSFGSGGGVFLPSPSSEGFTAIGADRRRRVVIAGGGTSQRNPEAGAFVLRRLTAAGTTSRHFGRDGVVTIGLGPGAAVRAEKVLTDKRDRVIVGGIVQRGDLPTGYGFALARYVPGH